MTNPGSDRESIRFQATTENELKHVWVQIQLLWQHNQKRREEIATIGKLIWGALVSFAISAAGLAYLLLKQKIGF